MTPGHSQVASRRQNEPRLEDRSPPEVLALAIHIERAGARWLRALASVIRDHDEGAAQRCEELAREQDDHEWKLVQAYQRHFGDPIPSVPESEVSAAIGKPELERFEDSVSSVAAAMRVYELALRTERRAQQFYFRAAATCRDSFVAALYRDLGSMADAHVDWCEARIRAVKKEAGR